MIDIKDLSKGYSTKTVLQNVNIHIPENQMVAILGKSGAGKSTLLHIMGTLDTADSGEVYIKNQHINDLSSKKLALFRNQHIGFVFQFHYLLPEFSAIENICMPAWIQKNRRDGDIEKKALNLLNHLGMDSYQHAKPNQLSGGEQQRISIARALINNPSYILADEPTGNLDTTNSLQFINLILKLKKENPFTFVMVTHNESLTSQFDEQILIVDGHIE